MISIISAIIKSEQVPFRRRFYFKTANWGRLRIRLATKTMKIPPLPEINDPFVDIHWEISKKTNTRGCRTRYIPEMSEEAMPLRERYQELSEVDPFAEDIVIGEELMSIVTENCRTK